MMKAIKNKIRLISEITAAVCVFSALLSLSACGDPFSTCDHIYNDGNYEITEYGHRRICDTCGEQEEDSEPHKFSELITAREPSENADGEGYYGCYICGYRKTTVIHDLIKVERVDPTCHTLGTEEHYKCRSCNKLFDRFEREIEPSSVNIYYSEHHAANPNPELITAPTSSASGKIKFRCDSFDTCGGYVSHNKKTIEIILPPLSLNGNYSIVSKNGAVYVLSIKESYVDEHLSSLISADIYRDRLAAAAAEIQFSYCSCDTSGHSYAPTSFVTEDNRLYFVCENDPSHRLEIILPTLDDDIYVSSHAYANCVRPEGTEYKIGSSNWRTLLGGYESELVSSEYTLNDYISALSDGFALFVSDGGEPDGDNHIHNDKITVVNFSTPTYDIFTGTRTEGWVKLFCDDCKKEFTVTLNYNDGVWRDESNLAVGNRFYRDYRVYGKTVSSPARNKFYYVIDTNGGEPISADVEVSGDNSYDARIIKDDFVRDGWYVSGVQIASVDGKYTTDTSRITETTGWLPNYGFNVTYWDVDMSTSKYMGDVKIKLLWHAS